MRLPRRPGRATSAFPNREETLALQASLLDGEAALQAWEELSSLGGSDEGGIAWIAPLLHANLYRLRPEDPLIRDHPRYLTMCRLREQAVTRFAAAILGQLEGASIPTLALKGLALGASVYGPGLRTISDLDILVPVDQALPAIRVLKGHPLRSGKGEPLDREDLRSKHAHAFYSSRRHELAVDLHWHVLSSARGDHDDAPFWSEAVPLSIGGVATRRLCAEDQLLHILVHGVRWTRVPHVRWVADAALVLREAGESFRAERFLAAAREFDVVASVREGLRFLSVTLGEGRDLFEKVRAIRPSRFAERAFRARATAYETRTVTDRIAMRLENGLWSYRAHRRRPR